MAMLLFCLPMLSAAGCHSTLEPDHYNSPEIKTWIFLTNIDEDYYESILTEFHNDVVLGNIHVEGYVSTDGKEYLEGEPVPLNETLSDVALHIFETVFSQITYSNEEQFRAEYSDTWDRVTNRYFSDDYTRYCSKVLAENPQFAEKIKTNLFNAFMKYCSDYAEQQVSVLNWNLEKNSVGDTYTGYLVTYEIGYGFYVLTHLVEFDDEDRGYHVETIYAGTSFTELIECIED